LFEGLLKRFYDRVALRADGPRLLDMDESVGGVVGIFGARINRAVDKRRGSALFFWFLFTCVEFLF
jgi:hypothetical protein